MCSLAHPEELWFQLVVESSFFLILLVAEVASSALVLWKESEGSVNISLTTARRANSQNAMLGRPNAAATEFGQSPRLCA